MNFPQTNELHVFIPDLHLITAARRFEGGYQYGTNYPDLLEAVVGQLQGLKRTPRRRAKWWCTRSAICSTCGGRWTGWIRTPTRHRRSRTITPVCLTALRDPDLNAQFLLGNHDYDLYRFPNFDAWQRSFVLAPSVMLLHGDVFDWVEKLPDELQNLALFLFTEESRGTADLEKMRPLNQQAPRRAEVQQLHSESGSRADREVAGAGRGRRPESGTCRWRAQRPRRCCFTWMRRGRSAPRPTGSSAAR